MEKELSGTVGTAGAIRERAVLDLAGLSEHERARALQAFEHLAPGDCLEVRPVDGWDHFSSNCSITAAVTSIGGRSSAVRSYGG